MKLILAIVILIPFLGIAQYDSSPQFGAFVNGGLRDFTTSYSTVKTRIGLDAGINIKHSTRNGRLRLVYSVGMIYDQYKLEDKTIAINRFTDIERRVKGVSVFFRPEFKIMNKELVSMYIGVGPRFSAFYSFLEKRVTTENGITTTQGWEKRGTNEVAYFGMHAAIAVEYKFAEHWALNMGLNAFTSFEFEFYDGNIYSGGNVTTGVAYIF
ncbi:outer membrane beta-barrel protein [Fluviicola taffensis]|uniref:Outer membrane protein beta-barrel domain-containing protein n=1 Tax=Fluviicola taffensis (strain DSM 16823 / NCIMB 13979 / RW262) TaxID=755732 RepID=F2IAT4_FLUTR|nr:outer membrane beta-barrel protein [Fluviicola taffensis]AEA44239.1 hypothetical protein Fluta_2253 [Fluviicola taffensis DSM 16823]